MCFPTVTKTYQEPKQGYHQDKYCPLFHLFKCVIIKQHNLGILSNLNCKNQIRAFIKMLRYAKAID